MIDKMKFDWQSDKSLKKREKKPLMIIFLKIVSLKEENFLNFKII